MTYGISWCPSCDLPLCRTADTSGDVSWTDTLGQPALACPRCSHTLPSRRPVLELVVEETNAILAEMGEPRTCGEEVERWRAWQVDGLRRMA